MDEDNSIFPGSGILSVVGLLIILGVLLLICGIVTSIMLFAGSVGPPGATAIATSVPAIVEEVEEGEMDLFAPSIALGGLAAGNALLTGEGMPGSIVRIFDGSTEIGETTVNSDGNWSFEANASPDSNYMATGQLADGTAVGDSSNVALTFAGLTAAGFAVTEGGFDLGGTGEPGFDVNVNIGDINAGSTTIGTDGAWSLASGLPDLGVGEYTVSAEMVDANGVVFDSVADAGQLSLTAPAADLAAGDFSLDGRSFAWTGTGEPGSTVNVLLAGAALGSTVVAADGSWSFDADLGDLDPGEYELSAEMVSDDGSMLGATGDTRIITIAAPLAALTTGDLDAGDGIYTWSGTGEPGSTITVFLDGQQVGETTVADDGTWTFEGDYAGFSAGDYPLTARMADGSGNVIDEAPDAAMLALNAANLAGAGGGDSDATGLLQVAFAGAATAGGDGSDGSGSVGTAPAGSPGVALILDSSWSMTFGVDYTGIDIGPDTDESQRLTGDNPNSRIAVAKGSLIDFVTGTVPEGIPTALRVFGNLRGNLECQTDLMVPLGPLDKEEMASTIGGVFPQFNANTAIGASLDAIRTDLAGEETGDMTVVLVTDGDETCGGDPEAAIEALANAGFDMTLNIIGFAINDVALKEKLEGWAELGNGSFFDAADAESLSSSLVGAFAIPYRVLDADGAEVATGTVGGNTVELPTGTYTVELGTSVETTYEVEVSADETTIVVAE